MKTLVVYFSRKGYTEREAKSIAARENADLLRLQTAERTGGIAGFWWCGRFGMHRWGMKLLPYTADVRSYERVIICSPVWVFTFCSPVRSFAQRERGNIARAGYVFVHFSVPYVYTRAKASLDRLLGITADGYESVCCMWGHICGRKHFGK